MATVEDIIQSHEDLVRKMGEESAHTHLGTEESRAYWLWIYVKEVRVIREAKGEKNEELASLREEERLLYEKYMEAKCSFLIFESGNHE